MNKRLSIILNTLFNRRGFTLVELLVSMTVFMIIASVMVANFRKGADRDDLQQGALLITSLLQQAQTYALAGYALAGTVPAGGYGLYLDINNPTKVVFFADSDGDSNYDNPGELVASWQYSMPPKVVIQSLIPNSPVTYTFRPPQGNRYLNGALNSGSLIVVVQHQRTLERLQVTANAVSGQVNISALQ